MPGKSDREVTVTISTDQSLAVVKLAGDLDIDARLELAEAVRRLIVAAPDRIDIDVAAVTYVGSVLPNFLVQVRQGVPTGSLTVSRPTRWTRFVLGVTNMAEIADIDETLSAGFAARHEPGS